MSKYNPGIAEFCANHPKKIAIARCPTCFKPYCFKDFTLGRRKEPLECRYCIEKYFNFRLSPLTYYFLTATPLIIVGIVSQALTEGWNNSGMLILLIFLIFLIPLSVFLGTFMVKSINGPSNSNWNIYGLGSCGGSSLLEYGLILKRSKKKRSCIGWRK
ncbi:MAG: hypothetical protein HWN65_15595 [Candidatus Helarchaeota archaeon]|nr:hypothetical protein [Candidatus Helarchaeota archaeon]